MMMKRLSGMLLLVCMLLSMPIWADETSDLCLKPDVEASTDKNKYHFPNWEPYMSLVQQKIRNLWTPPIDTSRHFSAVFTINRQGQIVFLKPCEPSGSKEFDRLALKAIKYSVPFPRFPLGYKKETISVKFTFDVGKEKL